MTIESMIIEGLHTISLALTPEEKWSSAASYRPNSATVALFVVLGLVFLSIVVALLFRAFAKKKRAQQALALAASELAIEDAEQQEKAEDLTVTNEASQQETVEVS